MGDIERVFFAEIDAGCIYHPKPGCVHPSDEKEAQFISSLTNRRCNFHAPALDIDYPMRLEKLDDKTTCVEIHIPKPEERAGLMLMDALVQSGITNKELAYAQLEEYEAGVSPIVLPLSVPARIVPSSTAGHFHFYIDHEMEWLVYKQLLTALYRAGVIGEDFYGMSVEWKVSFLLMPGLTKENLKIILHAGATSHQP